MSVVSSIGSSESTQSNNSVILLNPSIGTKGCLAAGWAYVFRVSVMVPDRGISLRYVDLTLDPVGLAISIRWNVSSNIFIEINDAHNYIELGNSSEDIFEERIMLDYVVIFHWNYTRRGMQSCRIDSMDINGINNSSYSHDVYYVIKDVIVHLAIVDKNVVNMNDTITFSGQIYYYNTTIPPSPGHIVMIYLGNEIEATTTTDVYGYYNVSVRAGKTSFGYGIYNYTINAIYSILNQTIEVAVEPPAGWSINAIIMIVIIVGLFFGTIAVIGYLLSKRKGKEEF